MQQLHDMQRGRDRAVAADRYDVALAAQVQACFLFRSIAHCAMLVIYPSQCPSSF
jgi:hypothetical protein